ncbi:MAG: zf-TFIIB domain-containing protein [Candidatus Rokuibacteriota bacterium]
MPIKPSDQEEEYFARQEFERRKNALAERDPGNAEEERLRVLTVARDRCPRCGAALVAVPYRGVEVDKCSRCEGIWLDCGELERVVAADATFLGGLLRIFR